MTGIGYQCKRVSVKCEGLGPQSELISLIGY